MAGNYYNEYDLYVAKWLRNLINAGLIPDGDVDTRSIEDVRPSDLRGYTQCHFFAGIGGWPLALRLAGWPDDRPIWTGSCPCQPFSTAGKGLAFADERHLWPAFSHLISERKPPTIVGEQVASKDVDDWIDLVHADLEAMGYAFASVPFPSASVGSPQLRDRNYWGAVGLADSNNPRLEGWKLPGKSAIEFPSGSRGMAGQLANASYRERDGLAVIRGVERDRQDGGWPKSSSEPESRGTVRVERAGPTNGPWRAADWISCTDGKWRPIEPGTFPLADAVPGRVGRLRAYGNAINPEAGAVFMEALMECMPC